MLAFLPLLAALAAAAPSKRDENPSESNAEVNDVNVGVGLPLRTVGEMNPWGTETAYLTAKYANGDIPQQQRRGLVERDVSSASLNNIGVSYTIEVDIGYVFGFSESSSAGKFDSLLDTGSTVLWVISNCSNAAECGTSPIFKESESSTLLKTDNKYKVTYGRGSASGHVAYDNVTIAGQTSQTAFVLVDEVTEWGMSISSLVGFAPRASSWYQRVATTWDQPLFSLYLGRASGSSHANPTQDNGLLTLGGIDSSKFSGDVHYIDANTTGWWAIPLDAISANGQAADLTQDSTAYSHIGDKPAAVIDSGTTLINGPRGPVTDLYKKLNAVEISTDLYVFPCAMDKIPPISLTFGGKEYFLDPADAVMGASTVSYIKQHFNKTLEGADNDYYCRAAIDIFDPPKDGFNAPSWIIGASFMRSVYTVHRIDPPAVGFASVGGGGGSTTDDGTVEQDTTENTVTNQEAQKDITSGAKLSATPRAFSAVALAAAAAVIAVL